MGQISAEQPWGMGWEVRQDQDPRRFRVRIISTVVGGLTCTAIAGVRLICGR